jgi:hypothetical protein
MSVRIHLIIHRGRLQWIKEMLREVVVEGFKVQTPRRRRVWWAVSCRTAVIETSRLLGLERLRVSDPNGPLLSRHVSSLLSSGPAVQPSLRDSSPPSPQRLTESHMHPPQGTTVRNFPSKFRRTTGMPLRTTKWCARRVTAVPLTGLAAGALL